LVGFHAFICCFPKLALELTTFKIVFAEKELYSSAAVGIEIPLSFLEILGGS
jgi:hypothetical protein